MLVALNAQGESVDPRYRMLEHRRALLRGYALDAWFGRFNPFPACWVAMREGEVVGMVSGEPLVVLPMFDQPPTARIDAIWVEPAHRRTGVARAMVARFREAATAGGYPRLQVTTLAKDARAIAFWRALGLDDLQVVLSS